MSQQLIEVRACVITVLPNVAKKKLKANKNNQSLYLTVSENQLLERPHLLLFCSK